MRPRTNQHQPVFPVRRITALLVLIGLLLGVPALLVVADPPSGLVTAARAQIGITRIYDPAYVKLTYPGGDVPRDRGVCTDVVIRAMRDAFGLDLQQRVHADMRAHFDRYPRHWGLSRPDPNIDHRRVPNLQTFFKRQGWALPVSSRPADYRPGDLVTCTVPRHRPHIMIVSNRKTATGVPYVIHNIGAGAREEARLFEFPLTGHYRMN
ncbi:conserved hypothetical protein [Desulfosarcina cetonica]|uniref:DUF1287 domain-containing protein n=1 Tax=Desulfosarcina cetonica TaxID=90730 RepID=UPI0006D0ADD2|nr:DUF1287 domain-containing protein [Desulfosarcina cetonica]VTR66294.1 conserved hypothetical protein [Desulfosarcina cetonica]